MSTRRVDFIECGKMLSGEIFLKRTTQTLTGAYTIPANANSLQILDANGAARNVTLPLESASDGKTFMIHNPAAGAFALTLLNSSGGALSPAVTVAQNKAVQVYCDGVAWRAMVGA